VTETLYYDGIETPIGFLSILANDSFVRAIEFQEPIRKYSSPLTELVKRELMEYFAGTRQSFSFPTCAQGTPFEQNVWNALLTVPFGSTSSYRKLAHLIGDTKAIRAVGRANGANPIAIAIPCHRIIGGDGSLTGYAGGLWRKRWLLDHEARISGHILF